jgi:uncharacterized protein with HEPN domain
LREDFERERIRFSERRRVVRPVAQRLDGITRRHRDVDWRGLAGLRDRLAHQYFRIDQVPLWNMVAYDLPSLRAAISAELQRQPRP